MALPPAVKSLLEAHQAERDVWAEERRKLEAQISHLEFELMSRDELVAQMRRASDLRDEIDRARVERIAGGT